MHFLGSQESRKLSPVFLKVKDRRHVHARPHKGGFCTFPCLLAPKALARAADHRVTTCSHRQRILARRHSRGTIKDQPDADNLSTFYEKA